MSTLLLIAARKIGTCLIFFKEQFVTKDQQRQKQYDVVRIYENSEVEVEVDGDGHIEVDFDVDGDGNYDVDVHYDIHCHDLEKRVCRHFQ